MKRFTLLMTAAVASLSPALPGQPDLQAASSPPPSRPSAASHPPPSRPPAALPAAPPPASRPSAASHPPPARLTASPHADYIDPLVGTGGLGWGVGSTVPGASRPFGMVKVSPDTTTRGLAPGFAHCGGYWYPDKEISGFSHNHLSGAGVQDQGNIRVMPLIGMDDAQASPAGYRSTFNHSSELASAGYYAVTLDNGGIRAELTAAEHTAVHRYTFPATNLATVLIDASAVLQGDSSTDVSVEVLPAEAEIVGAMTNLGSLSDDYGGQRIYFSAHFQTPFREFGVFSGGRVLADQTEAAGEGSGAYAQFTTTEGEQLELEVGISYISIDQARLNREVETTGLEFEEVREDALADWEEAVSVIDVQGGTDIQRRIFYSGLYHTMMMPTLYTDVNGLFVGLDQQVHQANGFTYYTDMSTWDTYRTLHPLLSLIAPARQGDFVTSMLDMYDRLGYIDRWPQGSGPTGCMIGDSPAIIIADSYLKGVTGFDVQKAYQSLRTMATLEGPGWHRQYLDTYLRMGYLPADQINASMAWVGEYAWDDGALAYFASALGRTDDAAMFAERATWYRNVWNPETGYLQGRNADGAFVTPFHPHDYSAPYYDEGDAEQYTWYAQLDMAGLIDLFGGRATFLKRLEQLFQRSSRQPDTIFPDLDYWAGNEPDINVPYLFIYAGAQDSTAKWVRWAMSSKYRDTPDGLDGNDDGGALSAWYIFSAMGFYPVPGSDVYLIGSPLFTRSTLHLKGGDFVVSAPNASETNLYIQSATLNGKPLQQAWFRQADLAHGGVLELTMGPKAVGWDAGSLPPPSLSTGSVSRAGQVQPARRGARPGI